MKKNVDDLSQQLSSVRGGSTTDKVTLRQIFENINEQFRKLSEQNESVETRRLALEEQVGELSKVITGKTSDTMGTKDKLWKRGQ